MADPEPVWSLTIDERETLEVALDALLPPDGSFPAPSRTRIIDDFILKRVPTAGALDSRPYPGLDSNGLKMLLQDLMQRIADASEVTAALEQLEREQPERFAALWLLAVYGYYSRLETIAAIQRDLAPAYHGAPQPVGYAFAIEPWDPDDPLQMPREPRGSYIKTDDVRRVDVSRITWMEKA